MLKSNTTWGTTARKTRNRKRTKQQARTAHKILRGLAPPTYIHGRN